jgi:proteasome lid subunit RPN8/RPN11
MSARRSAERPPPGYAPGAWRRFCAGLNGLAQEARLGDPALLARDLAELADEAQAVALELDPELFELVRLASEPLDDDDDEPPARDPDLEARLSEFALDFRDLRAGAAIEAAVRESRRVEVTLTASGERIVRPLGPRTSGQITREQPGVVAAAPPYVSRGTTVRATTRRVPTVTARRPEEVTRTDGEPIIVPWGIADEIREHARAQPDGFESCGRIVVRLHDRRVVDYHRIHNGADAPGKAQFIASWRPLEGHRSILIHSHPRGEPTPSLGDLRYHAEQEYRRVFAIYGLRGDEIRAYELAKNGRGYVEVPTVVEPGGIGSLDPSGGITAKKALC